MCSTTTINLPTWVSLLQEANRETEKWKESCYYWKHKYQLLYREYMHVLNSLKCERYRHLEDGELCAECSSKSPWKIPQKELDQLIQYYKGELTENALLNKAAN